MRGSTNARSSGSVMCSSSAARIFPSAEAGSSSSPIRQRIRTMSASAQYVTPSPYERQRPRCQYVIWAIPSKYL